jgi:D-psicose/D-tagatose/L-ribulose 3-epimerase
MRPILPQQDIKELHTMKVGMNMLLWATHVTEEHYPIIAKLKKAGFDGIEVPIFEGDDNHYKQLRRELDRQGLRCTTVGLMTPEANPISPDSVLRDAAVERFRRLIGWTAILGGDLMAGPFHSPLGVFSGEPPTEDEKKRAVDVFRQAADEAQKAGIRLAIEYLNRFECYFLTTAADTRAVVKHVNHPHFRMMYDTFHANIEEKSPAQAIAECADSFIHVHISENDRGTPGTGMVHWDETFKALRQTSYDGWLTIESFGRALPALAAATKVWRDLFPSAEEVYTQGLRFIKEKWAGAGR